MQRHRSELENFTKVATEKRSIDHHLKKGIEHVEVCFQSGAHHEACTCAQIESEEVLELELEVVKARARLLRAPPGLAGIVNLV